MSDEQKLLNRISGMQFAAWELHIYLDTHPNDTAALKSYKEYDEKAKELIKEYENKFGPLMSAGVYGDTRWEWINNPWPWEVKK